MSQTLFNSEGDFKPASYPVSKSQGYVLITLLILSVGLLTWNALRPRPKYEYKVLWCFAESNERTGTGAFKYASINIDEKQLQSLRNEGWELVDELLEMETAFPNFGSSE